MKLEPQNSLPIITVFGVGGAGGNAVNNMITANLQGAKFVIANTDAQAIEGSLAETKIQLGPETTSGLGAGAKPEKGCAAAQESEKELKECMKGSNMIFITTGMGGGTGTGAAPVIAQIAKEEGILTVAVATKPFHFEGAHRMKTAEEGLRELQKHVDTLIIIPNQNLFRIANENTTFSDAFKMADNVLHAGVRGVTDLMMMPGLINLDFADIRTVMSEMGKAMMGTGEASGENRAINAAEAAIANPLLDHTSMKGARGVLINITGGDDMTLFEVDAAANRIREEVGDSTANIIFGSTFNPELSGTIRVSVVATGIDQEIVRNAIETGYVPHEDTTIEEKTFGEVLDSDSIDQIVENTMEELDSIISENNETSSNFLDEEESIIERSEEYSIDAIEKDDNVRSLRVTEQKSEMFEEEDESSSLSSVGSLFSRVSSIFSSTKLFSTSDTQTKSRGHISDEEDDMESSDLYDVPTFLRNKKK